MHNIAVIPGDGTGPEVIRESLRVLKEVARIDNFRFRTKIFDFGGERYLKTGDIISDDEIEEIKSFDAILLGAIGHPDVAPGILERGILLKLRFVLDQYINLRPVKLLPGVWTPIKNKDPKDIDFLIVRENVEGLYCGEGEFINKDTEDEVAIQVSRNTRKGIERCIRYAFEMAQTSGRRNTLLLCGKTNVLTYAFDLWERVFQSVGESEYPEVTREYGHVDAVCMWMVKNPDWFDVIVTDNMFGDIITDLGAMIQGGMGVAAGGNINPHGISMFEPIGGSTPKYTGLNVINPIAAIMATKMMLEHLGESKSADRIERAVMYVTANKMESMNAGKMGFSTTEVGDVIIQHLVEETS